MEMPKQIRDRLSEKVRELVKRNKKGHLKYRDVVVRHIDDLLGCKYTQTKGFYGGWSRCYSDDPKYIAKKYFKSFPNKLNEQNEIGETALFLAIKHRQNEIGKYLLFTKILFNLLKFILFSLKNSDNNNKNLSLLFLLASKDLL